MPFFRIAPDGSVPAGGGRLVYYAHVPKCGGSAVATYIAERFGPPAFHDNRHLSVPEPQRWSRTSPQHIDAGTLERLIPLDYFDAIFAVVRHPVARIVSTYHFQREVEGTIPEGMGFSDWLALLDPNPAGTPFAYDNHIRPMDDIVPQGAAVFHLEHGLDALVPWFDHVAGRADGPRAILPENTRGAYVKGAGSAPASPPATPTPADLARIATLYAADFARFGYEPASRAPKAPPPAMTPEALAARDRALAAARAPLARTLRGLGRRLRRLA